MPLDGVIRVEDLLRSPALQLRLIAGEAGTSRRVAWAHVSELEDPTPWLFGAEMIMTTGIALPRSAQRQRAYLTRLDDAGVACLALSEQLHVPPLTGAFLAAAGERGFPVVEVPLPVPFMAIAQEVAAAVQGDTGQRLNAQLQVFGAVRWLAAGNLSTRESFDRRERLSGYRLYACTTGRGPLLDGVPAPPPDHAKLIPTTPTSPPTVPGGYVLPVSGPRGTVGYILAMKPLDSHIRTANPFAASWMAALICYPPFILMGDGGPLDYHVGTSDWTHWFQGNPVLLALVGAVLVGLTAIYAWATIAFGFRFSNLTHRGILTHGPYRFSRHPAYLSKNLFWWISTIPVLTTGSIIDAARATLLMCAVSGVYYWRARTEERHLGLDPAYRDYSEWMTRNGMVPRFFAWVMGKSPSRYGEG